MTIMDKRHPSAPTLLRCESAAGYAFAQTDEDTAPLASRGWPLRLWTLDRLPFWRNRQNGKDRSNALLRLWGRARQAI